MTTYFKPFLFFGILVLILAGLLVFLSPSHYLAERATEFDSRIKAVRDEGYLLTEKDLLNSHPLGQNINHELNLNSFRSSDPLVATYYFYWYDNPSQHFINGDGSDALTDHPLNAEKTSWKSTVWHYEELKGMVESGIDVALPVYWGEPTAQLNSEPNFSDGGLSKLVSAYRLLKDQGQKPPQIGMFYDTSSLTYSGSGQEVDLSTPEGKAWFYVTIRNFFSQIPSEAWATVDSRPIVFLYIPGFATGGADDPSLFPYVYEHFAQDFGGVKPYIVAEASWPQNIDKYAWGGALGLKINSVATLGPGYDDRAVPGRERKVVSRENGEFYSRSWKELLSQPPSERPKIAVVETWNEYHEGSEIAPTVEYGRQYIELTRKYADLWHAGLQQ